MRISVSELSSERYLDVGYVIALPLNDHSHCSGRVDVVSRYGIAIAVLGMIVEQI